MTEYTSRPKVVYNTDEILEAKMIIVKSLKSGKLLVEYSKWEMLSEESRKFALIEMTCPKCRRICLMDGRFSHMFGVDACCAKCDDDVEYPHLKGWRKLVNKNHPVHTDEFVSR